MRDERRIAGCATLSVNRDCRPTDAEWCARGMWLALLLKGVLVGIVIALPAGPVGVLCIRRTIFHGRAAGFISGLGAASADAVFGIIAGFGLTVVSDWLLGYQDWLRLGAPAFCSISGSRHSPPTR